MSARYEDILGTAILGIDTLWGGDVMCASGTGRFIADSWFSDEPLPRAYTDPSAARVRASGGVSAKQPDREAIDAYLKAVDIPAAIDALRVAAGGEYVRGLAGSFQIMWDLAMELLGRGAAVPYERCVIGSTGQAPQPSDPRAKRERLAELLGAGGDLLEAADEWRSRRRVPMASIRALGAAVIAWFGHLSAQHVAPHLPTELRSV